MPLLSTHPTSPTRTDDLRAAANIGLAITQALAGGLPRLTGQGASVGDRSRENQGAVTPTGGAFAIWGPLFLDSLGYAVAAALPDRRSDPVLRQVGWLTTTTYAANTLWTLTVQRRGIDWTSVGVIVAATTAATAALLIAERTESPSPSARLAANTIAPLVGWLSVAACANVDSALIAAGGARSGPAAAGRSLALLTAASGLAGTTALTSGNPLFSATAAWGLGGVALRARRDGRGAVAVAALSGLATLVGATLAGRRRG